MSRKLKVSNRVVKISTRAELTKEGNGKLSKVLDWGNGHRVEIPINPDGSVKWFDDSKLLKKTNAKSVE